MVNEHKQYKMDFANLLIAECFLISSYTQSRQNIHAKINNNIQSFI